MRVAALIEFGHGALDYPKSRKVGLYPESSIPLIECTLKNIMRILGSALLCILVLPFISGCEHWEPKKG